MSTTERNGLTEEDFGHLGNLAALRVRTIAEQLNDDRPEYILEHIGDLNDLADLARWTTSDGQGELTEGGLLELRNIHLEEIDDVARVERDSSMSPDDLAFYRRSAERCRRAIALAEGQA